MEPKREHTIKLRFGNQTRNPSNTEVFEFFRKQGWTCDDLSAMYREDYCLFVRFQTEEFMKHALTQLGPQVTFEYADGSTVTMNVSAASGTFKYVRIFGLPPEVDDKQIGLVMSKYGKIQQMVRERYPAASGFPIWNGVRGIHMEVVCEIPAQLQIQHIKARAYYDGLQNKCFKCGAIDHVKADCPKQKSVNERLTANRNAAGTFASIVTNGLNDPASSSHGMVVLQPTNPCPSTWSGVGHSAQGTSVATKSNDQASAPSEMAPRRLAELSTDARSSVERCTSAVIEGGESNDHVVAEESVLPMVGDQEMENANSNPEPINTEKGWREIGKTKKRDRKSIRRSRGDESSENEAKGPKQLIVPAGVDLFQAQATRSRSHETRSVSCESTHIKK